MNPNCLFDGIVVTSTRVTRYSLQLAKMAFSWLIARVIKMGVRSYTSSW